MKLPWSAEDYASKLPPRPNGIDSAKEAALEAEFQPLFGCPFPLVSKPTSIVDRDGCILAWYLPRAFREARQVTFPAPNIIILELTMFQLIIWNMIKLLQPLFKGGCDTGNWRTAPEFFKNPSDCPVIDTPPQFHMDSIWTPHRLHGLHMDST